MCHLLNKEQGQTRIGMRNGIFHHIVHTSSLLSHLLLPHLLFLLLLPFLTFYLFYLVLVSAVWCLLSSSSSTSLHVLSNFMHVSSMLRGLTRSQPLISTPSHPSHPIRLLCYLLVWALSDAQTMLASICTCRMMIPSGRDHREPALPMHVWDGCVLPDYLLSGWSADRTTSLLLVPLVSSCHGLVYVMNDMTTYVWYVG